ncbi:hypothetical protein HDU76_011076 [Blyttiomyces sp. JEL0837]|nr:hypothetical protein HDU76_011076 [Blyttiomyces sp. JEL0837]
MTSTSTLHLRTELTDLLGIKFPILCPPMVGASGPELVSEVGKSGGLGFLAAGYSTDPVAFKAEIAEVNRLAPNTPFGVGFITWSLDKAPQMLDAVLTSTPPPTALWFSFGDASAHITKARSHLPDIKILAQVQSVTGALEAVDVWGVDCVIAQGREAGGHGVGDARCGGATMVLVPEICDAVGDRTVVVAAGGIIDGRGVAASLMLGAAGAVMGTRFTAAQESRFPAPAKRLLVETSEGASTTLRTRIYEPLRNLSWPKSYDFRILRNELTDAIDARGNPKLETVSKEWKKKYDDASSKVGKGTVKVDDYEKVLYVAAGEGVGLVKGVWPVSVIMRKTLLQTAEALSLAAGAVDRTKARL